MDNLTNNKCESWNSVSKAGMNVHPNIWVVIEKIRKEESLARSKIMSVNPSIAVDHPTRRNQRQMRYDKLKDIVSKFHTMDIDSYMSMVSSLYNF